MSQLDNWHTTGNNHDRQLVQNWLMNAKKICGKAFQEFGGLQKMELSG
jgi:hypothetical protein